jgi:hypothetical protein
VIVVSEGALLGNLALSYSDQGTAEARDLHEQALALHREIGDRPSVGIDLNNLATHRA